MRSEGSVPCIPACQHPPTRLLASPDARLRLARACDAVMLLLREPGGAARATVRASEQRKSEGAAEASELRLEVYWKGEPGARRRRRRVDAPARTPREDARRRAAAAAAAGTHVTTHVRPWALCWAERCGAAVGSGWERLKGGRDDVQPTTGGLHEVDARLLVGAVLALALAAARIPVLARRVVLGGGGEGAGVAEEGAEAAEAPRELRPLHRSVAHQLHVHPQRAPVHRDPLHKVHPLQLLHPRLLRLLCGALLVGTARSAAAAGHVRGRAQHHLLLPGGRVAEAEAEEGEGVPDEQALDSPGLQRTLRLFAPHARQPRVTCHLLEVPLQRRPLLHLRTLSASAPGEAASEARSLEVGSERRGERCQVKRASKARGRGGSGEVRGGRGGSGEEAGEEGREYEAGGGEDGGSEGERLVESALSSVRHVHHRHHLPPDTSTHTHTPRVTNSTPRHQLHSRHSKQSKKGAQSKRGASARA
mmetsp:Transcript_48493/g.115060  ORF Transcript_48493/g.115060 Transcript_48493/m.115060 type:complete len:478 (-) Transcript_48493:824-2257(-)